MGIKKEIVYFGSLLLWSRVFNANASYLEFTVSSQDVGHFAELGFSDVKCGDVEE